ncbi:MAG: DNA helicase RecG, partial [Deltaproteobacteria bacterium]
MGIDVPNSTLMVIEHPERLGLSQLHQLRGRVGRGALQSECVLVADKFVTERLRIMEKSEDGFEIAEEDLRLRGPGEFLGTQQSGLPGFRVGHILRDA